MPEKTSRYIAKCKPCNVAMSTEASSDPNRIEYRWNLERKGLPLGVYEDVEVGSLEPDERTGALSLRCFSCGKTRLAKRVLGRLNRDIKCTARCLAATGQDCECSCAGKNHGAKYSVDSLARPNGYSGEELDEALERLDELIGHLDFSFVQEGDDLSFRKPKAMGYHYTSKRNLEAIEREGLGGRVSFEPHEFAFWLALPYIAAEDAASVLIDAERDRERSRSWSPGDPSQKTLDKLQALLDKVDDLHVVWFYREPGFAGSTAGRRETCVKFNLNDVGDWLSSHAESVHEFTDHADGYAVAWIGPKIPPQFLEDCGEDF